MDVKNHVRITHMRIYIHIYEHTYSTLIAMGPYALTRFMRTLLFSAFSCTVVGACRGCVTHDLRKPRHAGSHRSSGKVCLNHDVSVLSMLYT